MTQSSTLMTYESPNSMSHQSWWVGWLTYIDESSSLISDHSPNFGDWLSTWPGVNILWKIRKYSTMVKNFSTIKIPYFGIFSCFGPILTVVFFMKLGNFSTGCLKLETIPRWLSPNKSKYSPLDLAVNGRRSSEGSKKFCVWNGSVIDHARLETPHYETWLMLILFCTEGYLTIIRVSNHIINLKLSPP